MEPWSSSALAASAVRPEAPFPARFHPGIGLLPREEPAESVLARRPALWPKLSRAPGPATSAIWPRPAVARATAPSRPSQPDVPANGAPRVQGGPRRRLGSACLHGTGFLGAEY